MEIIKSILKRANEMCSISYIMLKYSVILSCLMLAGAIGLVIYLGELSTSTYNLYYCALEMLRMPFLILLIGIIGSACVEDMSVK